MKIDLIDQKGKKLSKQVDLEASIFEAKINDDLEAQALRVYQYNQRKWSASAKTRGEVRGGGKKPWQQKGTGRARHGSSRSPLWIGGGVTFGPRPKTSKLKIAKKMKKAAIRSALSRKAANKAIFVVDKLELKDGQLTKQMVEIIANILPKESVHTGQKVNLVINELNPTVKSAATNLKGVSVSLPEAINIYGLSNSNWVIFTPESLESVTKVWKVRNKKS